MARSIPRQTQTRADTLRDLLESCYRTGVNISSVDAEQARALLDEMDRILALFPQIEAQGVDLRAERGRWQEVQGAVRRHAHELRAALAPMGGLKKLRGDLDEAPSPERWWWWLDVIAHQRRRKRIRNALAALAVIVLLLWGGVKVFEKLFPVDPAVAAAYEHKSNADNLVAAGKLSEAVIELEAARQADPDDLDTLSMLAALYQQLHQPQKAASLLQQLREAYPPSIVDSNLAQAHLIADAPQKALALALQAIEEDAANPQGYLVAGMAYEADGDVKQAMDYYQRAADVAHAAEDTQSEAFAKIRLATLLQSQNPSSVKPVPFGD